MRGAWDLLVHFFATSRASVMISKLNKFKKITYRAHMIFLLVSTLVYDKMEWIRDKLMTEGWLECYLGTHLFIQLQKIAKDGQF